MELYRLYFNISLMPYDINYCKFQSHLHNQITFEIQLVLFLYDMLNVIANF